ncbi:thioesterase family protein [Leucobacter sp. M11]|uniref:thioesterase family protein n=1 Tax=Leucobacter sp. M11 TaxID=2993565 RepID=UPI002D80FDE6|nr:thioesterase family protein [Leucobacter sp. M11]MEB4614624.1 thioesterase family protein [Leucobacter sp. M11]
MSEATAYYRDLGDGRFASTQHAQGAWREDEQHMGPATGVLVHAIAAHEPRAGMRIGRVSLDIHGVIFGGDFEIRVRTVRPGRTIELVEAEMICRDRTAIVARAWRLATGDTAAVAGSELTPIAGPEGLPVWSHMADAWGGGYIDSVEFRPLPGHREGKATAWLRNGLDMVEGVPTSPLVRLLGMADTANGIATRVQPGPGSWMFPNVDLQLHLLREPVGEWLGLDTEQSFGADGIGLTSSVLHDIEGPFGRAEQLLTVRPLPAG